MHQALRVIITIILIIRDGEMKIDLSDLSQGNKVFSTIEGELRIENIINDLIYPNGNEIYYINGKLENNEEHPSLFHSIEECIEYFQHVKKEMDKEK